MDAIRARVPGVTISPRDLRLSPMYSRCVAWLSDSGGDGVSEASGKGAVEVDVIVVDASGDDPIEVPVPRWVIALGVAYLVGLALLALAWSLLAPFRAWAGSPVNLVPLTILWWGALGAVTVSFDGMVRHRHEWDAGMNLWHAIRPAIGAIVGAVSYLIFLLVVEAATSQPVTSHGQLVYFLVAFLVGYREGTFRALIKRATDMLFTSAPPSASATAETSVPSTPEVSATGTAR